MSEPLNPFMVLGLVAVLGLLPIFMTLVTSYIKIVVVLFIVRNALGIQQTPPNMVLTGLALILSVFVMAPVGVEAYHNVMNSSYVKEQGANALPQSLPSLGALSQGQSEGKSQFNFTTAINLADTATEPLWRFLKHNTDNTVLSAFEDTARRIWPKEIQTNVKSDSPIFLIPAFVISELTKAFQIGFLLYLPFVVIDLIVSNILLAMGMMMLSPITISLPFKLMLFVTLDGWLKLSQGLMLSYGYWPSPKPNP